MALNKDSVNINFAQGLDQKNDPKQLPVGKFLRLVNAVFTKLGGLNKRAGFPMLNALPSQDYTYLTTFNGDLTALGYRIAARSKPTQAWVDKGRIQPMRVSTLPLIRSNTNQTDVGTAVANGLVCTVYGDNDGSATTYKYAVADVATGQNVIVPSVMPANGGTVDRPCRVFALGNYFVVVMPVNLGGGYALQVMAISLSTLNVRPTFTISTSYAPGDSVALDGESNSGFLYLAWNGASASGIKMTYLDSNLNQHNTAHVDASHVADYLAVCIDSTGNAPIIYVIYNSTANSEGYILAVDAVLTTQMAPTQWSSSANVLNVSGVGRGGACTFFWEEAANYSYNSVSNHIIQIATLPLGGSPGGQAVLKRSVGIASKAFLHNGAAYLLAAYDSVYQPSYFLIQEDGSIVSKLAYSNGTGYVTQALPSTSQVGDITYIGYELKTQIQAVNKSQGVANSAGIYAQTGLSLAAFNFTSDHLTTAEIGNSLFISGGFLWAYDGYEAVEQSYFVWPDNVDVSAATSGGHLTAQHYFYQVVYEWQDNQGNLIRSAPSIPVGVTTTGTTSLATINVPTLRLTYKVNNPVKITVFRWSTAQQSYYQVTSISSPVLNDPSVDFIAITDGQPDSAILGNSLIYTTGGVLENIQAPPCEGLALFDDRLWLIDSEDRSTLWFSKQVLPTTGVETSDLLTYQVLPVLGANSPAGPNRVLYPLDDKLIIARASSLVYLNGTGPNNLGNDNGYSQATFITATVGSDNPQSFVLTPNGLVFESDKGLWLLGRNLTTAYIGAPVETITQAAKVLSAIAVPATNQIRFTMDSGEVVMYDYYFDQWGTFEGIPAISSTVYEGAHTFINSLGQVAQQAEGIYLDGSKPVLLSFTTGWLNLMGLQGYERFYQMFMLGEYKSPFTLNVGIAFDYQPVSQTVQVLPDNYSPVYGGDPSWGAGTPWGGPSNIFEARVFPDRQKCEAFQVAMQEVYDGSYGVVAGAGLSLSGLNLVVGAKKKYRTSTAARSFG